MSFKDIVIQQLCLSQRESEDGMGRYAMYYDRAGEQTITLYTLDMERFGIGFEVTDDCAPDQIQISSTCTDLYILNMDELLKFLDHAHKTLGSAIGNPELEARINILSWLVQTMTAMGKKPAQKEENHMAWMDNTIKNVLKREAATKVTRPLFKLVVAGTRTFDDYLFLREKMDAALVNISKSHNILIINGAAQGADHLSTIYAEYKGYEVKRYPAEWEKHGRAAGPIRNAAMAKQADAAIVFWDGVSPGTASMIKEMEKLEKPCKVIRYTPSKTAQEPVKAAVLPATPPATKKGLYAFVDGSWKPQTPEVFGSSYVLVEKNGDQCREMGTWSKALHRPADATSRNVAGEAYAAMAAMIWSRQRNIPLTICYDYTGIEAWCTGKWKANASVAKKLLEVYASVPKGLIRFMKVKAHSGNRWNDRADELAKAAVDSFTPVPEGTN